MRAEVSEASNTAWSSWSSSALRRSRQLVSASRYRNASSAAIARPRRPGAIGALVVGGGGDHGVRPYTASGGAGAGPSASASHFL